MKPKNIPKIITLLLLLLGSTCLLNAQPNCGINYTYDNAGNRIKRSLCISGGSGKTADNELPADLVEGLTENTGVEEEEVVEQLNAEENDLSPMIVFPNPSSGKFSIEAEYSSQAIIRVFDMSGRVLWQQNYTSKTIDLTHLSKEYAFNKVGYYYETFNNRRIIFP
ncbi:MAG: T9SS type A sorting domain-containing protein [Chitinophagales bacterium]